MRTELSGVLSAIESRELPTEAETLFGEMWDRDEQVFRTQETFVLDYKDRVPEKFTDSYGASIARLAIGMFNTYGGIVVFGIEDVNKSISDLNINLDIEGFSDFVSAKTGAKIEFCFRTYRLTDQSSIGVLLVPKRASERPIITGEALGSYPGGVIWIRDRHSVRKLDESSIPLIYTDRDNLYRNQSSAGNISIHRSLPPSPATMQEFIGREAMLITLWDWLVYDSKPRYYLHGPGGSGKSTLAYEFSRQVSERGNQIRFPNGDALDYVIFISAKETELNVYKGVEQEFYLRRFTDTESQYRAILVDSGMLSASEAQALDDGQSIEKIADLFNTYSGLIVIDDIDALSRNGLDTGEEGLFFTSMQGSRKTRILYTLRHPPSSALASSLKVPELKEIDEFPKFVELFAKQIGGELPTPKQMEKISKISSRLPLLIETIIGLQVVCGSYDLALDQFKERGGDAARRYLYQREYDRLEKADRAREVLAALYLLDESVSFSVLSRILGFGDEGVRNAISECGAIFLLTEKDQSSEVRFQLAHPAKEFIGAVSSELKMYGALSRRVDLFLREDAAYTPEESSFIVELEHLIRLKRYQDVVDLYEARPRDDPSLNNQKVQALVGQGYAQLGPDARTKARECFQAAYRLKFIDVFMARAWFYIENESDYGNKNAIDVCESFLDQPHLSARYKSEFKSKLASCYLEQARRLQSISTEKSVSFYKKSISSYLSALWIARYTEQIDEDITLRWLRVPCSEFVRYLGLELAPFFDLLAELTSQKHDVHLDGAQVLMMALRESKADRDDQARKRVSGLTRKAIRAIEKDIDEEENPGFHFVLKTLRLIASRLV